MFVNEYARMQWCCRLMKVTFLGVLMLCWDPLLLGLSVHFMPQLQRYSTCSSKLLIVQNMMYKLAMMMHGWAWYFLWKVMFITCLDMIFYFVIFLILCPLIVNHLSACPPTWLVPFLLNCSTYLIGWLTDGPIHQEIKMHKVYSGGFQNLCVVWNYVVIVWLCVFEFTCICCQSMSWRLEVGTRGD